MGNVDKVVVAGRITTVRAARREDFRCRMGRPAESASMPTWVPARHSHISRLFKCGRQSRALTFKKTSPSFSCLSVTMYFHVSDLVFLSPSRKYFL